MTHIEWIESSKTWICPKSGKYKVICVGGGASGACKVSGGTQQTIASKAGGTTSFGSYLSANGGAAAELVENVHYASGFPGFTGFNYGGAPSIALKDGVSALATMVLNEGGIPGKTTAPGYGAGGGAIGFAVGAGNAGRIKVTIVDLEVGQNVACTIGTGGSSNSAEYIAAGADGVIVVQYLGA